MPAGWEVINKAQEIVNQIQSGNLVLMFEARNIEVTTRTWKDALGRQVKEQYSLTDAIGKEVANFVKVSSTRFSKSDLPSVEDYVINHLNSENRIRLHEISCHLIDYIEQARANGVLENRNVTAKLKEYQEENERLKKKVDKLEKDNQKLHATLKSFGKTGFVSDVTDEGEDKA